MKVLKLFAIVSAIPILAIVGFVLTLGSKAETEPPDPSPRVMYLGWEYIGGNYPTPVKDGVPTRSSVFVDRVTGQEILCLGEVDSRSSSCVLTGRRR